MHRAIAAAAVSAALLVVVATVAIAQTKGAQPLPAIQVCVGENGGAVTTPKQGACARGTLAELAQYADAEQLYAQLAGFEASLSDLENELTRLGGQLDENTAEIAKVEASLDRSVDLFRILIALKYPVQLEFSNQSIGEQGTCDSGLLVRDALPGSNVEYRATPSSDPHILGPVDDEGTFKATVQGHQGQQAELVVISLAGTETTHWADPCY